ncbi:hypothetical protein GCM10011506_01310 [Marivirga lumbricoides]|uniref:Uncharacterized protein n=1 Tax=Marivirga lumbricoides TaxID=1046115 RepID=A0A2T4DQP1_9BACT|nr:hypothetical protein C9994_09085 [Marivirga lumbricoides]GGC19978.1 hypothetical protein GCM10011506_01310 [Marivirga lumbricoides]
MSSKIPGGGGSPISKTDAAKMIEAYKTKRLKLIKETYGIDDTQSVWFKREVFEQMLKSNPNMDGIRIYFGVNYQGVMEGHQNVVLVGTTKVKEGMESSDGAQSEDDEGSIYDMGTPCPPACSKGGIG